MKQHENKRMWRILIMFLTLLVSSLLIVATAVYSHAPTPADVLLYSTFLGAAGTEEGRSIAFDEAGNAYVVGFTDSLTFPNDALAANGEHGVDVYVAKFNADASQLDYLFWFNAATLFAEDYGYDIAVDGSGSAYVTGDTRSNDFCTVFGAVPGYDQTYHGNGDAFALKINAAGTGLDYCTFLGGSEVDIGRSIVVAEDGRVTVAGGTWSADFPTTLNAFDSSYGGTRDAFVAQLDATGTNLTFATFLGMAEQEEAWAADVDGNDNIYVTGWTRSTDFYTTTNALATQHGGGIFDGFLLKLAVEGDTLAYATFLGDTGEDKPTSLYVNEIGQAYVAGYTNSPNFPTTPLAFDGSANGGYDGFVLKMNTSGSQLLYSTLLGGGSEDWGWGLAVDEQGVAYVVGETWSADFPTAPMTLTSSLAGGQDAFVAQVAADGRSLHYSTFWGGSDWDHGYGLAINSSTQLYITGQTLSADFPTTPSAYDVTHNSGYDSFIAKLQLPSPPIVSSHTLYLPTLHRWP